jgi:outer membrane protein assembly factor BamD
LSKRWLILLVLLGVWGCSHKPAPVLPVADQFKLAKNLYDKNKFYKAQMEFEKLIYSYPGNTVIDTAQFFLAMSFFNQKDYVTSASEFNRLIQSYPQSEWADDSQYQIGMCHYKMSPKYSLDQSETFLAIEAFQNFVSNFIGSPLLEDARARLRELDDKLAQKRYMSGMLYLKMGDYNPAIVYFWNVRDSYPSTEWAVRSIYYTGEAQLSLKQYDKALETFQNFIAGFPDHKLTVKAKQKVADIKKKTGSVTS